MPKGYFVQFGYMGKTKIGWIQFACESDYYDYISESENEIN